jgi:hypothetical protein
MKTRPLLLFAVALAALAALPGCAASFHAHVARFHKALPPPAQGQSFAIQADDPALAGSLEFAHYADLVARRLTALGYVQAADAAAARLRVRFSYEVDKGTERVVSSPVRRRSIEPVLVPVAYSVRDKDGNRTTAVRYVVGYRDPYLWGFDDFYDRDIDSYTVYQSRLTLKIDTAEGERVFEGTARARSLGNKLTYLVPNLIDALFSGFPGKDGEDIEVTIAPEPKARK